MKPLWVSLMKTSGCSYGCAVVYAAHSCRLRLPHDPHCRTSFYAPAAVWQITRQARKAIDGETLTKVMLVRRGGGDDSDRVEAAKGGVMTRDYCSKRRCPLSFRRNSKPSTGSKFLRDKVALAPYPVQPIWVSESWKAGEPESHRRCAVTLPISRREC